MAGIKVMLEVGPIEIDGSYSNLTRAQEIPTRFLVILSVLGYRRIATISRLTTTVVWRGVAPVRRDATAVASGLEEGDDMSQITCQLVANNMSSCHNHSVLLRSLWLDTRQITARGASSHGSCAS